MNVAVKRTHAQNAGASYKSIRSAAWEFNLTRSAVHKVLYKNLRLYAYKVQLVQALQPDTRPLRTAFGVDMLARIDENAPCTRSMSSILMLCFPVPFYHSTLPSVFVTNTSFFYMRGFPGCVVSMMKDHREDVTGQVDTRHETNIQSMERR
ncbi:hypothetical protein ANN_10119 [Periplaneta americana]|uniref:Uncharacterized protein n=1 Tax=Periplaneta americana TaxID=6978 RepID=A0ABQ8TNG7_PERAM|nr:hypothetical protein ANN_10119 [Periplaneta americana]